DDEKRAFRPDVIVRLPDDKDVIIDSKVSLVDYEAFVHAEATEKEGFLKRHIEAIRRHIESLAEKKYEDLEGVNSLDFILMFMPIESAFILAFQNDSKIFQSAFEKKIIIVTPTTLLATLGTIKNMWKFQRQNVNAQKIAQDAGKLLDKFRGFVEDLERLGAQISTVQKSYDATMNKLVSGKGNLVASATKIQNLGVQMKKPLPKNIIEQSEDLDLSQD
ncbi:DNA recombination protein RmuC, partial [Francisellaceae bacterium]|nr:DNA recombination protein RmuC [Francisellaceae bacterium]